MGNPWKRSSTDPQEKKEPPGERTKTGGGEGEKQKATNTEMPKGMSRTREREGAQKTQKAADSAQREDPVAEGTGDSTEAEECPETERKT